MSTQLFITGMVICVAMCEPADEEVRRAEARLSECGASLRPVTVYEVLLGESSAQNASADGCVSVTIEKSWKGTNEDLILVRRLPHLREVVLIGGDKESYLSRISGLPHLESVIAYGEDVTDEGVAHVAKLPKLRALGLIATSATDDSLRAVAGRQELRWLSLASSVGIGDAGAERLKNLKNLEYLNLDQTHISERALVHLKDLTKMKRLRLCGRRRETPRVEGTGLRNLAGMNVLRELDARNLGVSDEDLTGLREMSELEDLQLGSSLITDQGLTLIGKLVNLRTLDLSASHVTAKGLDSLVRLRRLTTLDLSLTAINDDSVSILEKMGQLKDLDVSGTRMSMKALNGLRRALPGTKISSSDE